MLVINDGCVDLVSSNIAQMTGLNGCTFFAFLLTYHNLSIALYFVSIPMTYTEWHWSLTPGFSLCAFVFQDCTNPRSSAAGSSNAVKLSRFFDKVMASIKLFLNLTYDSLNSL